MARTITTLIIVAAAASHAPALNVINEWGGHVLNVDYQVEFVPGYGDRAVTILANPPPLRPWLLEAFDSNTHVPGDIHYIKIADGVTVGDISLSVVGNPNSTPPHEFGARDLRAINLAANGTATNKIMDLRLQRHLGADAIVDAPDLAGICVIGDQNDPQTGHVLNPIELDCFSGTLVCNELHNFSVGGGCPGLPEATLMVYGSYSHTLTIGGTPADPNLALVQIGQAAEHEIDGTITINRNMRKLSLARVTGEVHIGGSVFEIDHWGGTRQTGLLQIDGDVGHGLINGISRDSAVLIGGNVVGGGHHGWSVRVGTSSYDDVGMEGLLDVAGDAVDLHMYAVTAASATIHVGGDAGIVGFNCDLLGLCDVEGDVTRQIIVGEVGADPNFTPPASLLGELRVGGSLRNHPEVDCEFLVYRGDLAGTASIGGDCEGFVCVLQGNLTGRLAIGAYPNAIHHLSGSVHINGDLAGD